MFVSGHSRQTPERLPMRSRRGWRMPAQHGRAQIRVEAPQASFELDAAVSGGAAALDAAAQGF